MWLILIFLQRSYTITSILVEFLLADRTVNVNQAMVKPFALAFQLISAHRPVVDPSAQLAQIARQIELVKITSASILVPIRVVKERHAEL